jgi:glyoxylase-like metal-dependent hydrolase (beta-lactamase superfamily II)
MDKGVPMDEVIRIAGIVANCYLVRGERCYLVDTNTPQCGKKLVRELASAGVRPADLSHILITHYHYDHTGNLARLKRESGARVAAGAEDAPFIRGDIPAARPSELNRLGRFLRKLPSSWTSSYQRFEHCEVDLLLREGDILEELGLEVLALPGHTPGGIGLLDRADRRLFVGDLASNYPGRVGGPTICASYSREEIAASLRRLAELEVDYMYPGHGRVIGPRASEKVAAYARKML